MNFSEQLDKFVERGVSKMSSGKAFPRLWIGPKARTLEYGYTMFAHKESPAKDFEAWIPEKEHSALIAEKDKEIAKWKGEADLHLTQAMSYQKQVTQLEKNHLDRLAEVSRLRAALEKCARANEIIMKNGKWGPDFVLSRIDIKTFAEEALAGGKDENI